MKTTVVEIVRLVQLVAGPATEAEWAARAPGDFPAACRFCGDPLLVELRAGARVYVAVSHDVPVCPEFVQQCEDFEGGSA